MQDFFVAALAGAACVSVALFLLTLGIRIGRRRAGVAAVPPAAAGRECLVVDPHAAATRERLVEAEARLSAAEAWLVGNGYRTAYVPAWHSATVEPLLGVRAESRNVGAPAQSPALLSPENLRRLFGSVGLPPNASLEAPSEAEYALMTELEPVGEALVRKVDASVAHLLRQGCTIELWSTERMHGLGRVAARVHHPANAGQQAQAIGAVHALAMLQIESTASDASDVHTGPT